LYLVEHRGVQAAREPGRRQLRGDADRLRNRAVGLLAAAFDISELDQPGALEHADVEMEVAGIDIEPLCELTVRQRFAVRAELFEDAEAQRVAERLQLFRPVDGERVEHVLYLADRFVLGEESRVRTALYIEQRGRSAVEHRERAAPIGANQARRRRRA